MTGRPRREFSCVSGSFRSVPVDMATLIHYFLFPAIPQPYPITRVFSFLLFLSSSGTAVQPYVHSFLPSSIMCPTKAVKDANAVPRNCWAHSLHTCVSFHLDVRRYGMYDSETMSKNATLSTKFGQVPQPALYCA